MMPDRVVVGMSSWKTAIFILMGIVMISASMLIALSPLLAKPSDSNIEKVLAVMLGLTGFLMFGRAVGLQLKAFIKREPVVALDNEGFSLPPWRRRWVPDRVLWKDVQRLRRVSFRGNSAIIVELTDQAREKSRPSVWQLIDATLSGGQVNIPLNLADRSGKDIEALMLQYWQAKQPK